MKVFYFFLFTTFFISCDKDDPEVPNEEELITTVTIMLTPEDGEPAIKLMYQDLDGPGSQEPTIQNGTLKAGTTYQASIQLLNELEEPTLDINEEINEEKEEHQFFYLFENGALETTYSDKDANDLPVGLSFTIKPLLAGVQSFNLVLKHEPNKSAEGVAAGDMTLAEGSTDLDISFQLNVEN